MFIRPVQGERAPFPRFDWADHAVLVFTDTRAAGDLDVQAYKISPTGEFLWARMAFRSRLAPTTSPHPG